MAYVLKIVALGTGQYDAQTSSQPLRFSVQLRVSLNHGLHRGADLDVNTSWPQHV
jgi:hypothetical protein